MFFKTEVGHERTDHARDGPTGKTLSYHCVQELIAVVDTAIGIDHLESIRITIECNAKICAARTYFGGQALWMQRSNVLVDVEAIG